jgi:hypothetical protein
MDRNLIFCFLQLFANYCGLELRSIFNYSSGKFLGAQETKKIAYKIMKSYDGKRKLQKTSKEKFSIKKTRWKIFLRFSLQKQKKWKNISANDS